MTLDDALLAFKQGKLSDAELRQAIRRFHMQSTRTPLSEGQQGLWILQRLSPQWSGYNLPLCMRIDGELDLARFRRACELVLIQHPVLQSSITEHDGVPYQQVDVEAALPFRQLDASTWSDAQVMDHLQAALREPFALDEAPLIRVHVLTRAGHSVVLFVIHHIVFDGSSMPLLITALVGAYDAASRGERPTARQSAATYRDFVEWEAAMLAGPRGAAHRAYWRRQLAGPLPVIELPGRAPRRSAELVEGRTHLRLLPAELGARVRAWCRAHGASPAVVFLAAYKLLLHRYTGERDLIVGMPTVVRPEERFDDLVGNLINTIAVRSRLAPGQSFAAFVAELQLTLADALDHAEYPFPRLVRDLQVPRQQHHAPVFQVAYAYQNAAAVTPASMRKQLHGALRIAPVEGIRQQAEYEFKLDVEERDAGYWIAFKYDAAAIAPDAIARIADHFMRLLGEAIGPSSAACDDHALATPDEAAELARWNATATEFPSDRAYHELFEAHAARDPGALAAIYEDHQLTYGELDRRANQLAHHLRDQGIGPDQLVAICLPRGLDMIAATLGVLKAGGAYLPLDPSYPAARLAYMLEDSGTSLILTHAALADDLPAVTARVIELDGRAAAVIAAQPDAQIAPSAIGLQPHHLAYVIYTSGSTGKPKGVMLAHRGLCNLATLLTRAFDVQPTSRVLQFASFSFDACVWECAMAHGSGAALVLAPSDRLMPGEPLLDLLRTQRISHATLPPAAVQLIPTTDGLDALTTLVVAGEACPAALPRKWATATRRFVNAYGPTETTVCATMHVCDPVDREPPPIGRPIANMQIHILDDRRQPAPVGVAGEIYIGGAGVARGYLHQPELTADRFVADPASADPAARLYRTGDVGRWRADGAIEFLGRNDHQVKLRGFRIELGEIEAQLARHPEVREAVVIAREDAPGDSRLVAYLTSTGDADPAVDDLRAHLHAALPDYMVPAAFVVLPALPLTENGKLDRRALPAPELGAFAARAYEAPEGDAEAMIARIWQDVLRVARVGRHDNFFDLGGHSLLIVQMMERLRGEGVHAEVSSVFEHPTPAQLAGALATAQPPDEFVAPPNLIPEGCARIEPAMLPLVELQRVHIERIARTVPGGEPNIQDIYPLAPLQEGILFHHLLNEQWDAYVAPMLLAIQSRAKLDALLAAFQAVIDRHDILRTAVLWNDLPSPVQVVHRRAKLPVEDIALEPGDVREQLKARMAPERLRMDLTAAPLIRIQIARDPASDQWFLLLFQHHMIGDHVSTEIMLADVAAHMQGRAGELPPPVPYRGFVAQVASQARRRDPEAFFRGKLAGIDEPTAPFGLIDVRGDGTDVDEARQRIDPGLAVRIRASARALRVSPATVFHAAWGLVVAVTSRRDDVVYGSVLSGRLQGTSGADRVLGLFINTLPLRIQLAGRTALELVEHTQTEIVDLLGYEHASLAQAQRCSGVPAGAPLFSSVLNYRHSARTGEVVDERRDRNAGVAGVAIHERTNYPFTLSIDDLGDDANAAFALTAQSDKRVDPRRVMAYLTAALDALVGALDTAPATPALALSILPADEQRQVVEQFNATDAPYPRDRLVHQLFEEQVDRTPDAIAVEFDGARLTYRELDARANQLARYLRGRGIGPDARVAICMERSLEMVIAVVGVLKAGGGYVPLDPGYPADRLSYMLDDAAPGVVLTQERLLDRIASPAARDRAIALDARWAAIAALPEARVDARLDDMGALAPHHLAYVIYTSGSTGQPKGVAMPHRGLVNLIHWHRSEFPAPQRTLQFAALGFDVSFQETFVTLCTGGTLVAIHDAVRRDPRALAELVRDAKIQRLFVPFAALHNLAEYLRGATLELPDLQDVITAGEQLRITPAIAALFDRLPACRLHNHYGPTESHVVTSLTLPARRAEWDELPSIGRPIPNAQIYLLDERRQPVPVGVAGEIYIGGDAVARGYLGRANLTAERFLADPFRGSPGGPGGQAAQLYRTGDLGRWRADGSIDYLGRNDHQVKIRGFRVELGEIEAQLGRHPRVKQAVVVAREDVPGEKRLVAYLTPAADPGPGVEELRAHLHAAVPDYMVPAAYVVLPALPVNANGKLDRRALPAPELGAYSARRYEAPEGEIEAAIAGVWQDLLRVARVGRHDNFFDLGGHSLFAVQVTVRLRESRGWNLTPAVLFDHPTVAALADYIAAQDRLRELGARRRDAGGQRQRGIV